MAKLTAKKRKNLKASTFALPAQRKYPLTDVVHARNALARVAQHGTPGEVKKVKAAVRKKFPSVAVSGKKAK
jgi:hypothetical protein